MAPGAAIDRDVHRGSAGLAIRAGGLSVKADLADRAAIRRRSDQQQTIGVRQALLEPVVVISRMDRLWGKAVCPHLRIIGPEQQQRLSANVCRPKTDGCLRHEHRQ